MLFGSWVWTWRKRKGWPTPHLTLFFLGPPPFPMVYIRGVVEGVVEGLAFKVEATLSLFFVFLPLVTPCMIIQYIHMDSYSVWGKLWTCLAQAVQSIPKTGGWSSNAGNLGGNVQLWSLATTTTEQACSQVRTWSRSSCVSRASFMGYAPIIVHMGYAPIISTYGICTYSNVEQKPGQAKPGQPWPRAPGRMQQH